jgi:hypothetical protein
VGFFGSNEGLFDYGRIRFWVIGLDSFDYALKL